MYSHFLIVRQYPDEYDIEVIEFGGISELRDAHKVTLSRTNRGNNLDSRKDKKSGILLTIPVKDIEFVAPVRQTRGIRGKEYFATEISFKRKPVMGTGLEVYSILLNVDQKYNDILQSHVHQLKDTENSPTFQRQLKSDMHPELCAECFERNFEIILNGQKLCKYCQIKLFGSPVLFAKSADIPRRT